MHAQCLLYLRYLQPRLLPIPSLDTHQAPFPSTNQWSMDKRTEWPDSSTRGRNVFDEKDPRESTDVELGKTTELSWRWGRITKSSSSLPETRVPNTDNLDWTKVGLGSLQDTQHELRVRSALFEICSMIQGLKE